MTGSFNTIDGFFSTLNDAGVNYLVLRNFENLLEPEFYVEGHGDIDLLCDDSQSIVELVSASPLTPDNSPFCGDGIHYSIRVDGQPVKLDLRQVGDGYYCKKWEMDLLKRKIKHHCFYVMQDVDYFYTLIYHAVLQKRSLSQEYFDRLCLMSNHLGIGVEPYSEKEFIRLLENHMRENGYSFSYSLDYMVPNRFHKVDKNLIDKNCKLWWSHFKFDLKVSIIDLLVRIKHAIKL